MKVLNLTLVISFLLLLTGMVGYINSNQISSLLPSLFGIVFFTLALLSFKKSWEEKIVHISFVATILLLIATAGILPHFFDMISGNLSPQISPLAVVNQSFSFLLGLFYLMSLLTIIAQKKIKAREK